MYRLSIFYPAETRPRLIERFAKSVELEEGLRRLLTAHPGCARIEAHMDHQPLFSVDPEGERMGQTNTQASGSEPASATILDPRNT